MRRKRVATGIGVVAAALAAGGAWMATAQEASDADQKVVQLEKAVAEMRERVTRLKDTDAVENLVSIYGYYLDKALWDNLAGIFAEDGSIEISQRGVYVGRDSIRESLQLYGPQGLRDNYLHNHIQLQPLIHIGPDGKTAQVRSRVLSMLGTFKKAGIWSGQLYENDYVKKDGTWQIQTDHSYTTYFALYDGGWASGIRGAPGMSEEIPPDRPPSVEYEPYPSVYVPPFHYDNADVGKVAGVPALPEASGGDAALTAALEEARALNAKIARLQDENAIENLQRAYGFYVDKGLWSEAANLFAEGGTLEIGGRGVFEGRDRVLDYLRFLGPEGPKDGRLMDHLQLQPVIHVAEDGRTAKGRWHFIAQVGSVGDAETIGPKTEEGGTAAWGFGVYENEYVKVDGQWKIAELHSYFTVYTPYADGWAKTAFPNTTPEEELPPDAPPSDPHEIFPNVYIPPFHYDNPVSGRAVDPAAYERMEETSD